MTPEERKKSNVRLALVLASVAAVFFIGFMVKMALFGH
ncbi:MAG TPA: cytochrome oxidase small assembly protein [Ramlibacter sp.]